MNIFSLLRRLSSFQIIVLSFALLIGSGTLLLMTPWATQDGQGAALLPACFTAVSASCVTGLTVVDTASYWSHFGQLVILMLIQVGGLGVVTIFSCMLFGCLCGSPTATVAAIGAVMVPALEQGGYSRKFALSTIAAAGMLGTIIPPSTVMITYCSATGVSVGSMFMAGIVPGITLGALMIAFAIFYGVKNRIPRTKFNIRKFLSASYHAIGAIFMPIIILGGIYTGIFTPTESAAVACAYGLIVGCFIYREINFKGLVETVKSAAASSGMIMFIVACAGVFGLLMTREQIPAHAAEFIMSICSNKVVFLLLVNVLLLIVGCFMDTTPAILIIAPILFPALSAYNIDPVHFGIIMLLNMCIGMITPPLGINLYVAATLRQAKVGELVNRHLLKYMICCLVNLLLITYIPQICLWLPSFME